MRKSPRDPESSEEWQQAVDVAQFLLDLEDCRMYGLITGGPQANRERCDDILNRGRALGYKPAPVEWLARKFLMTRNPLQAVIGKTIKDAEIVMHEASDSCQFATLELRFDDGSVYSFRFMAQPEVFGIFFQSDDDDGAREVQLVKP